jgi:hypothetical protein
MIDRMLARLDRGLEADAAFLPSDPAAHDRFAARPEDQVRPWTLGHVIAHTTATAEEAAALAAEQARGIPFHGRSRAEAPWQAMTTLELCRRRLEESRRMRLASLEMWPDQPSPDTYVEVVAGWPLMNAQGRFMLGLMHDESHLDQISAVLRQAEAARLAAHAPSRQRRGM